MDLTVFADAVGTDDPVTITGHATRGGPVASTRCVTAPAGIDWIQPDEMTMSCGAGTPVDDLAIALAEHGQRVSLPPGGTVGGALAAGRSGIRRLGDGPVRDVLLQARYIGADGQIVKAGGPTVKNVSGFDVCRLLVGAKGTLGFLGEVILRTRPIAQHSQWFTTETVAPVTLAATVYRPVSVLWNGHRAWILLEGHPLDVAEQASTAGLTACDGPPAVPSGSRTLVTPSAVDALTGHFLVEVGAGVVHRDEHLPPGPGTPPGSLASRIKLRFDAKGRLNPGVTVA